MKKTVKLVTTLSLATLVLFACSEKEEQVVDNNQTDTTVFQGIDFDKIYKMDDNEVLLKIGDKTLTVGEVKKKTFEQALSSSVNQFIDSNLLMQKYTVSNDEIQAEIKRLKEALGENFNADSLKEETIHYQLVYNKAIADLGDYGEEDLKNIYKQYYEGKDARSYEELKEEIKKQAPFILGGQQINELQQELRKEAKIDFKEETLKQQFNMTLNALTQPVMPTNEEEKEEKPSN